jgi:hypothetical protein
LQSADGVVGHDRVSSGAIAGTSSNTHPYSHLKQSFWVAIRDGSFANTSDCDRVGTRPRIARHQDR